MSKEEETWLLTQRKVFTRFINIYLKQRNIEMSEKEMFEGGLDDGIILWNITEILSGMNLKKN